MGTINPWRAISIGAILGLALVGWQLWNENHKIELAEEAIKEVIDACHAGNAAIYADRKVKAEKAIRRVGGLFPIELSVHLDNERKLWGCP